MLQKLYIKNYILIDELEIDFSAGMNVITGETGAGKSIIIDAISLLMGQRSSAPRPVDDTKKVIIEGHFAVGQELESILVPIFEKKDWEWENPIIIRREFGPAGKNRVYLNDSPLRLKDLQSISPWFIELHQQFDHLSVRNSDFQLRILDSIALQGVDLMEKYQKDYKSWKNKKQELQKLINTYQEIESQKDYKTFVLNELREADFGAMEIEDLQEKVKMIQNSEALINALQSAYYNLSEGENTVLSLLGRSISDLDNQKADFDRLTEIKQRLNSTKIELEDVASEIDDLAQSMDWSEEESQVAIQRLDLANKLLLKHKVQNTQELLDVQTDLEEWLSVEEDSTKTMSDLKSEIETLQKNLDSTAALLSQKRKEAAPKLTEKLISILQNVGMENAQIEIDIREVDLQANGKDEITFLLDANRSGHLDALGKVASGGELNRIMLALKSIVAEDQLMPSLVFDEIDSGISGEPARQVGIIMKNLAQNHQVISITHQASIAAQGDKHFYIYKMAEDEKSSLQTQIKEIKEREREEHIAELISGKSGGESALAAAQKLLSES